MSNNRRAFIRQSGLLAAASGLSLLPSGLTDGCTPNLEGDRLVLLGTQGGPLIRSYKQTPSANLLVYQNVPFVVDAGYGVTLKLREVGINLATLRHVFITHHHSDHNLELGPLLYNAWIAGLAVPLHVYAPVGLKQLLYHYWASNEFDIETRIKDEGRPDIRTLVVPHEITEGTVLEDGAVTVHALKNIHPPVEQSFAFRFRLGSKVVVFSGDTAYCPALAEFAAGADYLVHEVMHIAAVEEMVKRRPNAPKLRASILSHHTSTADVGRIAQAAKVKHLVLNHFVPPDDATMTEEVWTHAVRGSFAGDIIVGKDLLQLAL